MCGRYTVVSKVKVIEERFGVKASKPVLPQANIGVGMKGPVIVDDAPQEMNLMTFGMTPTWAKKPMFLFNARAEGDHNKEDDPLYTGAKGIIEKPSFRKPIRSQRCLVIADAFFEGPKDVGLSKPYLFYLRQRPRPFAFAGIWDEWVNTSTGEVSRGFAIVTTASADVVRTIGHHRCPVILHPEEEKAWLDHRTPLAEITAMLHPPHRDDMNAYPISPEIKNARNQDFSLLMPVGERIKPEYTIFIEKDIELFGMGESRSGRKRDQNDQLSLF